MIADTEAPNAVRDNHDRDYAALLDCIMASFHLQTNGTAAIFETDAAPLYETYLANLPAERQVHSCATCRQFFERYGHLVRIDELGDTHPLMFSLTGCPDFYAPAIDAICAVVRRAKVTGQFLSSDKRWGTPHTGPWTHFAVIPPSALVWRDRKLSAFQAMAAAKESFRTVAAALVDFKMATLKEALRILSVGAVAGSEKFVAPVQWLIDLKNLPKGIKGRNLMWQAVATAPEGFCHPRAGVVGSLIEDIESGMSFDMIKKRFDAKLHPLAYQRPQAAPSAGNIKAAEALVEKLGIARSLERRFARVDEVPLIWTGQSAPQPVSSGGVFGHIAPKGDIPVKPVSLPLQIMTWEKFVRAVLPKAMKIECGIPAVGRFTALTTAVHMDAPPIYKWDHEDERNPIGTYTYPGGSPASQWSLEAPGWVEVLGIANRPALMGSRPMPHMGLGVLVILKGAIDTRSDAGNALFPECLRSDLHEIRSTVEAYSRTAVLSGREGALACGLSISDKFAGCELRVFADDAWIGYSIDRWD